MAKKRKKKNRYQALVGVKARFCKGKAKKSDVKKKASAYIKGAVSSLGRSATGKEKTKARKVAKSVANRVLKSACTMTAGIAKKRRKKSRK